MNSAAPIPWWKPPAIRPLGSRRWPWFAGEACQFFSGLSSGTRVEIEPAAIHYSEIKLISPFHHTPRFIREAMEAIRRGDILSHDLHHRRDSPRRPSQRLRAHEIAQRRNQAGRSPVKRSGA